MTQQIKSVAAKVKAFDEKHTNFSGFTYWMIFLTACAVWMNSFNQAAASLASI
jgi:hypothetical protein